jgi:hypothetical protein
MAKHQEIFGSVLTAMLLLSIFLLFKGSATVSSDWSRPRPTSYRPFTDPIVTANIRQAKPPISTRSCSSLDKYDLLMASICKDARENRQRVEMRDKREGQKVTGHFWMTVLVKITISVTLLWSMSTNALA